MVAQQAGYLISESSQVKSPVALLS